MKKDVSHFVFVFACFSSGDELQNNQLSMFLTKDGMLNLPGGYSRLVAVPHETHSKAVYSIDQPY